MVCTTTPAPEPTATITAAPKPIAKTYDGAISDKELGDNINIEDCSCLVPHSCTQSAYFVGNFYCAVGKDSGCDDATGSQSVFKLSYKACKEILCTTETQEEKCIGGKCYDPNLGQEVAKRNPCTPESEDCSCVPKGADANLDRR